MIYLINRKIVVVSRHVTFFEDQFPARDWQIEDEDGTIVLQQPTSTTATGSNSNPISGSEPEFRSPEEGAMVRDNPLEYIPPVVANEIAESPISNDSTPMNDSTGHETATESEDVVPEDERRHPSRSRRRPDRWMPGSAHLATVAVDGESPEPFTLADAKSSLDWDKWDKAITEELSSLQRHNTYERADPPKGQKPIATRFVFTKKRNADGTVNRYKARLVVKGYLQGDVSRTYAPVVDFNTIRVALAVGVSRNYFIHQLDVTTAFLHGNIDESIYITFPQGLRAGHVGNPYRLKKALYGLKQAPRLWNEKWCSVMLELGFIALQADECVFKRDGVWILLYVDDVIVMSASKASPESVKRELTRHLEMKDLGPLDHFLGVTFVRNEKEAWLTQKQYTLEVLKRFGMSDCRPVSTPMENGSSRADANNLQEPDQTLYQEVIGSLLYLSTRTRPDISAAVGILARQSANPQHPHWVSVKRVFRYLCGTADFALRLDGQQGDLVCYSDADWASDRDDRKSTSGVLF